MLDKSLKLRREEKKYIMGSGLVSLGSFIDLFDSKLLGMSGSRRNSLDAAMDEILVLNRHVQAAPVDGEYYSELSRVVLKNC